jgi:phage terminase Nu1 subunit (DNA packaging protein)
VTPGRVAWAEAARLLGVHRNTVASWIAKGCPVVEPADRGKGKAARLDLGSVLAWRVDTECAAAVAEAQAADWAELERLRVLAGVVASEDVSETEARRLKRVAEAELLTLRAGEAAGELVRVDDIARLWSEKILAAKCRLRAIPKQLAARHPALSLDLSRAMLEAIDGALTELAQGGEVEPAKARARRALAPVPDAEAVP